MDVRQHFRERVPILSVNFDAVPVRQQKRIQQHLSHKLVIAGRGLKIGAVGRYLLIHLAQHFAEAEFAPFFCLLKFRQKSADPKKADNIRKVMVAGGYVRKFVVIEDKAAVPVE